MRRTSFAIGAGAALVVAMLTGVSAMADDVAGTKKPALTSSTKPMGNGPADEKSLPSNAPAATTKQTTGATSQDKSVKAMNNNEKAKVEVGGK